MKVRDLLRKIVNREDLPQKIKINNTIYVLNNLGNLDEIYRVDDIKWQYYNFSLIGFYDNEVEVIEEEPRNIEVCGSLFTRSEYNRLAEIKEDKKIETIDPIDYCHSTDTSKDMVLVEKINEIIRFLYKTEKDK